MKRKWVAVALAGVLAVGMTACGGGGSASKSTEAKSASESASEAAAESTSEAAAESTSEAAAESVSEAAESTSEAAAESTSEAAAESTSEAAAESAEDSGEKAEVSTEGASITIFNSKMEIQSQMEEMAKKYSEEKGVDVEVYYSSDTVSAHLATKYASNDPYTISMVDAKDVYFLLYSPSSHTPETSAWRSPGFSLFSFLNTILISFTHILMSSLCSPLYDLAN